MDDIRWDRALLNGLYVWLASLAIWALPAVLYAYSLSTSGGLDAPGPAAGFSQLSGEVGDLYGQNWLLILGLIVITAVLVYWRARAVATGTWNLRWLNGLIVGAVPTVLSLSFGLCSGWNWLTIAASVSCLIAGLLGGLGARPT